MQITVAELHGFPVVRVEGDLARSTSGLVREALEKVVTEQLGGLRSPPGYQRASLTLTTAGDAVAIAEHFVGTLLTAWRLPLCLDPARLVTRELVGNAVVHGGGELQLHVSADDSDLSLSVADRGDGPEIPAVRDGGLGLMLVEQVSHRWGTTPRRGGGHLVWARLRCRRADSPGPCLP